MSKKKNEFEYYDFGFKVFPFLKKFIIDNAQKIFREKVGSEMLSNFHINEVDVSKDEEHLIFSLNVDRYDYRLFLFNLKDVEFLTKEMLMVDNFNYSIAKNVGILLTPISIGDMVLKTL